jgi:hypothetical protein
MIEELLGLDINGSAVVLISEIHMVAMFVFL